MTEITKEAQIEIDNYRMLVQKLIKVALLKLENDGGGLILRKESGNVEVMSTADIREYLESKKNIPIALGEPYGK